MKREIREVRDGMVQITTLDERYYVPKEALEGEKSISDNWYPSSSWIASCFPKGKYLVKWIADVGWKESQKRKREGGVRGSKVHQGIEALLSQEEVNMSSSFINNQTGREEELTVEEYTALMTFVDWYETFNPVVLGVEESFINTEHGYGGTIDLLWILEEPVKVYRTTYKPGFYVTDHKTSSSVHTSHEIQITSYGRGIPYIDEKVRERIEDHGFNWRKANLSILQVGYSRNKRGWKMTKVDDKLDLFLATKRIWRELHGGDNPKQVEFPEKLPIINKSQRSDKK